MNRGAPGEKVVHRLTLRFASTTMLAFLLVGAVLGITLMHQIVDREVAEGELRAEAIARSVMALYLAEGTSLDPASGARLDALDSLLKPPLLEWPVVRLKVWRADGVILFSDDHALIGRRFPMEEELRDAFVLQRPVSEVTDLQEAENVDERPIATKLLETYVPRGSVDGAVDTRGPLVELYQDYASVQSQAYRVLGTMGVLLLFGLGGLYALLLPIMRRVSRTLTTQNAELEAQAKRLEDLLVDERDATADRRRLLDGLFRSEEEDRRRIAAMLHDGPLHGLSIVGMTLNRVCARIEKGDAGAARPLLDDAQGRLSAGIDELRSMMRGLRPPALDERGLEAAIADQADVVMRGGGVEYELVSTLETRPESVVEGVVYRVAQEAMTNVTRHAHATHAWLSLRERDGSLEFEMRDDGDGFDPAAVNTARDGGLGLMAMRERVEMAGGSLEIDSAPSEGTHVRATLPNGGTRS